MDSDDVRRFLRAQAGSAWRSGCVGVRRALEWYRYPDVRARREDLLDWTRAKLNQGKGLILRLLSGGRTLDAIYLFGNGLWAFSGAGRFVAFAVTGEADTERLLNYLRGLKGARPIPSLGAVAAAIRPQGT